jgi:hypothetical protein
MKKILEGTNQYDVNVVLKSRKKETAKIAVRPPPRDENITEIG